MTRAATGSAQVQPHSQFRPSPRSKIADRYVHSSVCLESATADAGAELAARATLGVGQGRHHREGDGGQDQTDRGVVGFDATQQ